MSLQIGLLFLLFCINSCSLPSAHSAIYSQQANDIEPASKHLKKQTPQIQIIKLENHQIRFNTISTGCTQESHFEIRSTVSGQQCDVAIYRIKPDLCKRAPQAISITLKWDQSASCNNLPVKVLNSHLIQSSHLF